MCTMDTFELKQEQLRLARKIVLQDACSKIKTIGGATTVVIGNKLLACVVVCSFPSMEILETKTYLLNDPLPYRLGFEAYREMPALIEACNLLEQEPEVLLIKGSGILHPQRCGIASHVGLALNLPTIGVDDKLVLGKVEQGKIMYESEIRGFEVKTREHSNPVYVSPGHLISLGSSLHFVSQTIRYPHKLPEPLHLAQKMARKKVQEMGEVLTSHVK